MAINTITYADKRDINTSATPSTNKVSAADMNEIKSIVNTNATLVGDLSNLDTTANTVVGAINEVNSLNDYSSAEKVIGTWIDNKPVYKKAISTNYSSTIDTNVVNVDTMIKMEVLVKSSDNTGWRSIPWIWVNNNSYGTATFSGGFYYAIATGKIVFQVGTDLANVSKVIIVLEYTKTTD